MSGFLGSYVHQVDEKGRLSLPASFRRGVTDGPLVVVQVQESALTLYPEGTWLEVEGRLLELLRRQPESRPYVLGVTSSAALPHWGSRGASANATFPRTCDQRCTVRSVGCIEVAASEQGQSYMRSRLA